MIGLNDKAWLLDLLQTHPMEAVEASIDPRLYDAYFGLGHSISLVDDPHVFKVSLAGLALGANLIKMLDEQDLTGRFLDIGTGSGALALLLRSLGATEITASDLMSESVALAARNELLNFSDARITFSQSDLFSGLPRSGSRFDTIIFNPPGWRTPSDEFLRQLEQSGDKNLAPGAMFYGDSVLLRFLLELPEHLHIKGRAIIGVNSLVGIQDVFGCYRAAYNGTPPLSFKLLERHTFPLLFYSEAWHRMRVNLLQEFSRWSNQNGAAYTMDTHGNLYWSYELIECRIRNGTKS